MPSDCILPDSCEDQIRLDVFRVKTREGEGEGGRERGREGGRGREVEVGRERGVEVVVN